MLSGLAESGQLGEPILLLTKETTVTVLPTVASAVMLFTGLAFLCDLKTRRIPNWLTVISLVLALAFHLTTGGWPGLLAALGGFAVGFGILLVLWLIGGGGGGDVKMMGALGAWLGASTTLLVFVGSGLLAAVAWFGVLFWRLLRPRGPVAQLDASGGRPNSRRRVLPYAVPVTIVTWCVMSLKLLSFYGFALK